VVLALANLLVAGIGVYQGILLRRTDQTARISANAAQKAAEIATRAMALDHRAWIRFEGVIPATKLIFGEN
jgi:hypothetical protein